ncbi:MAG: hypothetical protein RR619_03470, partial [Raoultibacter sp.]
MERKNRRLFLIAGALLLLFIVFTIAVATFDVQAIGPNHSSVGFATINGFVFDELGTNVFWYDFTGLIGLVPILVVSCFAIVGLAQLIRRRSVKRMDADLLILAAFYCAVAACYVIFEVL